MPRGRAQGSHPSPGVVGAINRRDQMTAAAMPKPRFSVPPWLAEALRRPDRSRHGFDAAVKLAFDEAGLYEWASIPALCEHLACHVADSLHAHGVHVEFVASRKRDGKPLIVVRTDWGHREAVIGEVSFNARTGKQ